MASHAIIARRYSKALFEIAQQHGVIAVLLDDLKRVQQAAGECPELLVVLASVEFAPQQRKAVVDAVGTLLQLSATITNFIKLLIDKQRVQALREIVAAYQRLVDAQAGVITALVTTATPLIDSTVLSNVERVIGRLKGRCVRVESRVNPNLIGGITIRVGDEVFDGSVISDLRRVKEQLLRETL